MSMKELKTDLVHPDSFCRAMRFLFDKENLITLSFNIGDLMFIGGYDYTDVYPFIKRLTEFCIRYDFFIYFLDKDENCVDFNPDTCTKLIFGNMLYAEPLFFNMPDFDKFKQNNAIKDFKEIKYSLTDLYRLLADNHDLDWITTYIHCASLRISCDAMQVIK